MSVKAFMAKVEFGDNHEDCWHWLGTIGSGGYGRIKHHGKAYQAHRFSYESFTAHCRPLLVLTVQEKDQ